MISAILFDVDGTLVDSNDLHAAAWREAFLHFGHDIPLEQVRGQIGKGGDNLIPSLLPDLSERERDEIDSWRGDRFKRDYLPRVVPFPSVRALFERLYRDGVKIVLASSAKEEEVAFHRNLIGCSDLIHAVTTKSDVEHSKPCSDIFAAALETVPAEDAKSALVVGDSPYDIEAAAKLSLPAIALLCGGFPERQLRDAGAAEIYTDVADLLARYHTSLLSK